MTSPMILVVRMRSDTDGPNRLPGTSRLTLLRSNTGMSSVGLGVAWRGARELRVSVGVLAGAREPGVRVLAGARESAGRVDVAPLCESQVSLQAGSAAPPAVAPQRAVSPVSALSLCVCVT